VFKKLHPLIDNPIGHSPTWRNDIITEINICTRSAPATAFSNLENFIENLELQNRNDKRIGIGIAKKAKPPKRFSSRGY
jgi:hypothetical protein